MRTYKTFSEFWPFYLREHSRPRTRALHYAGTTLVVLIAITAAATGRWRLLLALGRRLWLRLGRACAGRTQPAGDLHPPALVAGRRLQDVGPLADRAAQTRVRKGRHRRRAAASAPGLTEFGQLSANGHRELA